MFGCANYVFKIDERDEYDDQIVENSKVRKLSGLQENMPLLVACSSSLRTPQLEKELEDCGFNMFLEAPVSVEKIDELITLMELKKCLYNKNEWNYKLNFIYNYVKK